MLSLRFILIVVTIVAATTGAAAQQPVPIGRVKLVSGTAFVEHQNQQRPATVGDPVFEADTLTTGPDGRIGVTLRDETRIALGPGSELRLAQFQYEPAADRLSFVMRMARGIASYVSGRIAKLAPDAVRLETPAAVIGVRGTRVAIRVGQP